jgi:hypothetical protein
MPELALTPKLNPRLVPQLEPEATTLATLGNSHDATVLTPQIPS